MVVRVNRFLFNEDLCSVSPRDLFSQELMANFDFSRSATQVKSGRL